MPKKTPTRAKSNAVPAAESVHAARPSRSVVTAASRTTAVDNQAARVIYCTVATARQLPAVSLLHESLVAAHGAVEFRLLLMENPAVVARLSKQLSALQILAPDDVGCGHWLHMAFCYDSEAYAAALVPALLRTLLSEGDVVYLDPHSEVLVSLAELASALQDAEVVAPLRAATRTSQLQSPAAQRDVGDQLDLSILAVKQSAAGQRLLRLWQDLVVEVTGAGDCDPLFTRPLWARAVAAVAPRIAILPAAQYVVDGGSAPPADDDTNAAPLTWWQHERAGCAAATGPADDSVSSRDGHRARYLQKLAASPHQPLGTQPYSFSFYLNGNRIPAEHRRALGRLPRAEQRLIDNPFASEEGLAQLARTTQAEPLLNWADPTMTPCAHCRELEARLNSLPHSLIGYAGKALGLLGLGARDRIYNSLQNVSAHSGRVRMRLGRR